MKKKVMLRDFSSAQKRREFLEKELNISLENIGSFTFKEESAVGRNIENLVGAAQIPIGVAGPLEISSFSVIASEAKQSKIDRSQALLSSDYFPIKIASSTRESFRLSPPRNDKIYYIPLATTEGALVASVSRGCKAITESGGASIYIEEIGITRGPVFKVKNLTEAVKTKEWIENNFNALAKTTESTSSHLKLTKADYQIVGRNLFVRFYFDTADAMGMNMATIATQLLAQEIEGKTPAKCIALSGNYCVDKKPSWLNFTKGRGKKVWAEVILPKKVIKDVLKSTPEKITEVVERKCHLGSMISGSLGFNSHFANIAAALFAATGQDLAHVTEASMGITSAEVMENGNLYFSIYLPSLIVGTVGGGTHLATQQESLKIMQVNNVLEYARVLAGAVLAGELSLVASLAEGTLAKAHQRLGRKQKIDVRG